MKKIILLCSFIVAATGIATAQNTTTQPRKVHPPFKGDSSFHKPPMPPNGFNRMQPRKPMPPMQNGFARGGKFGQQHPMLKRGMQHFAQNRIQLSKEQLQQKKTINENFHKQLAELQKNDKISLGDYKNKVAALQKDRKAKMQAVLTAEQKNKIETGKKRMQEEAQVREAANAERMKIHLNLSDEQVAKIKANQTAFKSKMKALHENDALLPEQKKEQMKALALQQKESFQSLLTAEQKAKADSLKKNMKDNFRGRFDFDRNKPGFNRNRFGAR